MCTALSFCHFFGRNFDLDQSYGEEVCVTPRHFPFLFRKANPAYSHYAMIGMATVREGIPLYYDAINEHGVAMAGLHFPGNAIYHHLSKEKDNIAPFEFIPWVLSQCKNLQEVEALLQRISIADIPFSDTLPSTPLHWMIATPQGNLTVESTARGVEIFENFVGVLANNPEFGLQIENLERYSSLTNESPSPKILSPSAHNLHSLGMGAVGLPGDYSSTSRFVRASFLRRFADSAEREDGAVEQFLHLLGGVAVPKGCVKTPDGKDHFTRYRSAMDLKNIVYYYTTYFGSAITAISPHDIPLDSANLIRFPQTVKNGIFSPTKQISV